MAYWNGTAWAPELSPAVAEQRSPSLSRRLKPAALLAILGLVVATGSVFAGKNSPEPRIDLATVNGTAMAALSVQPSLGDWVTFATTYPTTVKNPRIEVLCYQSEALVFGMAGGVTYSFQLGGGSSTWLTNGGAADCTANLFYFGWKGGQSTYVWLASTDFTAGG